MHKIVACKLWPTRNKSDKISKLVINMVLYSTKKAAKHTRKKNLEQKKSLQWTTHFLYQQTFMNLLKWKKKKGMVQLAQKEGSTFWRRLVVPLPTGRGIASLKLTAVSFWVSSPQLWHFNYTKSLNSGSLLTRIAIAIALEIKTNLPWRDR